MYQNVTEYPESNGQRANWLFPAKPLFGDCTAEKDSISSPKKDVYIQVTKPRNHSRVVVKSPTLGSKLNLESLMFQVQHKVQVTEAFYLLFWVQL